MDPHPVRFAQAGLERNSPAGLRDRCLDRLSYYGLLRGANARTLELPDLHSVQLKNEGFPPCTALVWILQKETAKLKSVSWGAFSVLSVYLPIFQLNREIGASF